MQEFINHCQEYIIVKDYYLEFTQLSKYNPTFVAESRDNIDMLFMGISDLEVNECCSAMPIESQGTPRFKRRFSNNVSSSAPRFNKDRIYKTNPQLGNSCASYVNRPNFSMCGKKKVGKCLVGTCGFLNYGKSCHLIIDCPILNVREYLARMSFIVIQIFILRR